MIVLTVAVLNNDSMMYKYVIVPVFDKKSFKALKLDMKSIIADQTKAELKDKAFVSVRFLLNDNSYGNVIKVQELFVKYHRKPFVLADIVGEDCSDGLNTTYVFEVLRHGR